MKNPRSLSQAITPFVVAAALLTPPLVLAQTAQLDFSVVWQWRYNVAGNYFALNFAGLATPLTVYSDTTQVGVETIGASTIIDFGPVLFQSPLSTLADMGVNMSTGQEYPSTSNAEVDNAYISQTNQGTWTLLQQNTTTPVGNYGEWLEYTADPPLSNPLAFDSADYLSLLESHVGEVFDYREDITGYEGGWQDLGQATLDKVTIIPEPSTTVPDAASTAALLVMAGLGVLACRGCRHLLLNENSAQ